MCQTSPHTWSFAGGAMSLGQVTGGGDKQLYEYLVKAPEAGPRAHKCTLCGRIGNDRSNLRKHVENAHFPGTFLYSCKYCTTTFPTRTKLNNHMSSEHKPISSIWTFQDPDKVLLNLRSYSNLSWKTIPPTLASISGAAPSVGKSSSAESLWGTTVNPSTSLEHSDTAAAFVTRKWHQGALWTSTCRPFTTK